MPAPIYCPSCGARIIDSTCDCPTIGIARLAGSDDLIVRVTHADGEYIAYRVAADEYHRYPSTWDVSMLYAEFGHDSHDDRARAQDYLKHA